MSVRRLFAAAVAALLGGIGLAAPAAAHASAQPVAASVYDFSLGRLGATTGALLGLAGVVIAWLALARPSGRLGVAHGPLGARTAMVAGLISIALGGLVAATADGGLGTGNGLGGAYVAMLVGLIGTALGGLALARSRRTG
ncbi:DUF6223 family protein [Streptomyces sp. S.PNR 29]|uniref:DUF6223 family protein n=1 Tax=Streptomyces sp. S.PNR 29 TaxID=2973805 RepID=UPI0025B0CB8E|nr:DUF6223 family protein [Streptomyces sp. S.PNR 29]MDN0199246.1 DUF6223 family protein [Streptomyces sp. S.PNR 29]